MTYLNDASVLTAFTSSGVAWGSITGTLSSQSDLQAELDRLDVLEKNLGINFLRDSIAEGWSTLDLTDGFSDVFDDQTGVDAASSLNEFYNSAYDFYQGTGTDKSFLLQSNTLDPSEIETFTDQTGTETITTGDIAPFHSGTKKTLGVSSIRFAGDSNQRLTIGNTASTTFDFGNGAFTVHARVNLDSIGSLQAIVTNYGDAGTRGWSLENLGSNGQLRFIYTTDGTTGISVTSNSSAVSADTWHDIKVCHESNGTASTTRFYVDGGYVGGAARNDTIFTATVATTVGARPSASPSQVFTGYLDDIYVIKGTCEHTTEVGGAGGDFTVPTYPASYTPTAELTLISNSQSASSAPTNARLVVLHEAIDSVTLNTDLVASTTRNAGSAYTTMTLAKDADYDSNIQILTTTDEDISGQSSGTSVGYKLVTANSKNQRIHGVYLQWR